MDKAKKLDKKIEIPHIFAILLVMIIIATICTWAIPAGTYDRVIDPASGREVIDPASFHYVDNTPVGPFKMFVCIEEGLIAAANIAFMILCCFSSLYLLEKTGAIDAAVAWIVRKTKDKPQLASIFIVLIMVVLAIWAPRAPCPMRRSSPLSPSLWR